MPEGWRVPPASRCWRGPRRHLPLVPLLLPARFRGWRRPFFLSPRHGGKNAVPHAHHTLRAHKSAPSSRAGHRSGTGRSARVSARPAGTAQDKGSEGSRPAKISPNFAERRAGAAAAPVLLPGCKFRCSAVAAEFGRRRKGRNCAAPRERSGAALRGGERAGPGAALEAAGAGGGGSVPMLRESSGKNVPFVLKVSYGGIFDNRVRMSGAGAHTCPQLG